jgi:hypothetical protein
VSGEEDKTMALPFKRSAAECRYLRGPETLSHRKELIGRPGDAGLINQKKIEFCWYLEICGNQQF